MWQEMSDMISIRRKMTLETKLANIIEKMNEEDICEDPEFKKMYSMMLAAKAADVTIHA